MESQHFYCFFSNTNMVRPYRETPKKEKIERDCNKRSKRRLRKLKKHYKTRKTKKATLTG